MTDWPILNVTSDWPYHHVSKIWRWISITAQDRRWWSNWFESPM